jgi:hypothetical protein
MLTGQAAESQTWTTEERQEWLGYARATWRSFESMTSPNGLTADHLESDAQGPWKPSIETSPTDIASYLWATLSARALDLIDDAETDRRLGATLTTLGRMDRDHGFFFDLYDVRSGSRTASPNPNQKHHPFLSSVDNAWLAVALTMVRNSRPSLRDQAEALLRPMDFAFFYTPFDPADPFNHPGQFHGGYKSDTQTFTAFYGMLNTEPRIISYYAIARGQVPAEQYYRMFRTYPIDRDRQSQLPQGVTRDYLDVPVFEGHYQYRGIDFVPSWGGSMFEALMVPLFVPEEQWAPGSWAVNHPLYARLQIYRSFEVLSGSKPNRGKEAGSIFEGVVTPHASFLALRYTPRESLANLRALQKAFPIFTENQGFHDSVNIATGAVSPCVLSLDQGMIMVAIANTLADDAMRRAFADGPFEATIRPIIAIEQFTAKDRRD